MGTTAEKLSKMLDTKAAIKAAIVEKGQSVSDSDTFASYPDKIRAIQTGPQLADIVITKQPTKTNYTTKEAFDPAGMEVKAIFSNDAYKFVADYTVEPSGALKPTDTKVKVKYTELKVTAEAEVAITVAAIKLSVPSVGKTPVYTGSAITPTWTGYDSSLMAISGDTSGINAGSYSAKFSLKDKVNYTWADGTTADKSVAWSIGKASVSIPTASVTSFAYSGAAIAPAWSDYNESLMAIGGNTSETNAGNYTTTFSLKDSNNYMWSDGTVSAKSVDWVVNKAQASIALDKTSVVLNGDKLSETVIISSVGMSSIMAMSSDPSVATVALAGNVLTITSVDETTGEATIAISGEVDSNYNAPEYPSVAVSAEFALPVILEVEKITSDTYAGETTYTGEEFILLDIYPKTNGTVKVTYGGLTKTITDTSGAEEPNAQQVFFGTFNGVSDDVETPASGELTIEGAYSNFAVGSYASNSKGIAGKCSCITDVVEWGGITSIGDSAFYGCTGLTSVNIPDSFGTIGDSAFCGCTGLTITKLPSSLTYLGNSAFSGCANITISELPSGLTYLGNSAYFIKDAEDDSGYEQDIDRVSLTFASLPSGLTYIGIHGCHHNDALTISTLPDGLTEVTNYSFRFCQGLTKIVIGNTVTTIGKRAFEFCNNLASITIGENVTTIEDHAFSNYCKNITITFLSSTPPTVGSNAFGTLIYNSIAKIIVPVGCSEAYKTALGSYADYIVEAS